jgi:hypothetical protein
VASFTRPPGPVGCCRGSPRRRWVQWRSVTRLLGGNGSTHCVGNLARVSEGFPALPSPAATVLSARRRRNHQPGGSGRGWSLVAVLVDGPSFSRKGPSYPFVSALARALGMHRRPLPPEAGALPRVALSSRCPHRLVNAGPMATTDASQGRYLIRSSALTARSPSPRPLPDAPGAVGANPSPRASRTVSAEQPSPLRLFGPAASTTG